MKLLFVGNSDIDSDVEYSAVDSKCQPQHKRGTRTAVGIKEVIAIDVNHPAVQKLIDMGYEPEQCLQAVENFPDDDIKALEYLMDTGERGELFASSIPTREYQTFHDHGHLRPSDIAMEVVDDVEEGSSHVRIDGSKPMLDRYALLL